MIFFLICKTQNLKRFVHVFPANQIHYKAGLLGTHSSVSKLCLYFHCLTPYALACSRF